MNIIWSILLTISMFSMLFIDPSQVLSVVMVAAQDAISGCVLLCGVYLFWGGIINIMDKCHLTEALASLFSPIVTWLYGKNLSATAKSNIAINMSANVLGISNASTPSAIVAIKDMEGDNSTLSRSGAMLFVVNATSLQILPTTVMGLRASLCSVSPADIVLPTIIATAVTTVLGITLVNICYGRKV